MHGVVEPVCHLGLSNSQALPDRQEFTAKSFRSFARPSSHCLPLRRQIHFIIYKTFNRDVHGSRVAQDDREVWFAPTAFVLRDPIVSMRGQSELLGHLKLTCAKSLPGS